VFRNKCSKSCKLFALECVRVMYISAQIRCCLWGSGKKRMCGYADVATGKMRMLMRRRIRILPVVEMETVIANVSYQLKVKIVFKLYQ